MYTPENITELQDNEIFVFGSNESGMHGAGAAYVALSFGAKMYQGFGPQGSTFAIPTKDWQIKQLDLDSIKHYINRFTAHAALYQEFTFLVTKIGCGLAGYKIIDIAPLFLEASKLPNVVLPKEFINYLTL